jgi:hypothetical protein
MNGRCLREKSCEIAFLFDLLPQFRVAIAGQPTDDFVNFFFRTVLAFRFLNV